MINERKIYGHRAISRAEASTLKNNASKQPKDKRNLKLLRVSLIRPGTSQANNMSEHDAKKRAKLAALAKTKLKNLHMFVSPNRLVVSFYRAKEGGFNISHTIFSRSFLTLKHVGQIFSFSNSSQK